MKLFGLRNVWSDGSITCCVLDSVEAPLDTLLDPSVRPFESVRPEACEAGRLIDAFNGPDTGDLHPLNVDVLEAPYAGRPGLVVARNPLHAAHFLVRHWSPRTHAGLDGAVRAARATPIDDPRRFDGVLDVLGYDRDAGGHRDYDRTPVTGVVRMRADFEKSYRPFGRGEAEVHLPVEGCEHLERGMAAVLCERPRRIGAFRIPAWDVLVPTAGRRGKASVRACRNGRWTDTDFHRLDPVLRDAFDREGRMVRIPEGDITRFATCQVAAFLRVPARMPRRPAALPDAVRNLPVAWVVDARSPVDAPAHVPVLTRAGEVAAILSRRVGTLFLPDAPVAPPGASFGVPAGSWLALCISSVWRSAV